MDRHLKKAILKDIHKKIILISGPRQVGKTTLSKSLLKEFDYYNYDNPLDRKNIHLGNIDFNNRAIILDELHKMKNWKQWLKGHYDTRKGSKPLLVTGSARMDTYKKKGDSLAGRFFQFRLLPLDVKEIIQFLNMSAHEAMNSLLELSGFPEPFLSGSVKEYRRWRDTHLTIILRQDLIETEKIKSITSIELLVELMKERVGSLISYNALREDLQTDDKSVKRWFEALENSYVLFKVPPYSKKIIRSISKSPKYYFFDVPRVTSEGARFENLVAMSLYKEILYRRDVEGEEYSLHFLRNKNQDEVDFLICLDQKPRMMIETKLSAKNIHTSFPIFEKNLGILPKVVLVKDLDRPFTLKNGARVENACDWLAKMPI